MDPDGSWGISKELGAVELTNAGEIDHMMMKFFCGVAFAASGDELVSD